MIKKIIPGFVKKKLKKAIKKRAFEKFKTLSTVINEEDLVTDLSNLGIKSGDVVLVHSSLKNLGYVNGGAVTVINALMRVIGKEGTLVFPAFSINESMFITLSDKNYMFDPSKAPSSVGAITETFRHFPGVERSIHPTHSVAAIGKHAHYIVKDCHLQSSNFGTGTPFGKILELNGKIVGLGTGIGTVTFYHVFEDLNINLFPDVYLKNPIMSKMLVHDKVVLMNVWCHNPEFHKSRIDKSPAIEKYFNEYFDEMKIIHHAKTGAGKSWYFYASDLMIHLEKLYNSGKTIYKI